MGGASPGQEGGRQVIPGYDAWKLASPPETNGGDRCDDCRGSLGVHEIAEGLCAECLKERIDKMDA